MTNPSTITGRRKAAACRHRQPSDDGPAPVQRCETLRWQLRFDSQSPVRAYTRCGYSIEAVYRNGELHHFALFLRGEHLGNADLVPTAQALAERHKRTHAACAQFGAASVADGVRAAYRQGLNCRQIEQLFQMPYYEVRRLLALAGLLPPGRKPRQ